MGWFEDFEKALSGLIDFLEDNDIPFEIIGEDDIEDEPEVGIFHSSATEEEDEEQWYEYYVSREDGYFGATFLSHQADVYYSTNPNAHQVAYDRFLDMYGSGWYGGPPPYGHEVLPDVDGPTEVDKDDVDDERIIQ